jgi:hypothetical protein
MQRDWWAPLTGVAFVVVLIVGFIVGGEPPDVDEPVAEIVDFYREDDDTIMVGAALQGVAVVLFVFFGGILRKALSAAEPDGDHSVLPTVAFAGTVVLAVGAAIDGTISFALAETADDIDPAAVQALLALWENDFLPMAVGLALLLVASGLSIVRTGALPKWLGWIAILLGLVAITPAGFVAFMGGALWVLIVSVMLTLRRRAGGPSPAGTMPA